MSELIDIRKYEFVSMPVKEQWDALVREDSPLAKKESIRPAALAGMPLISAVSDIAESNLGRWFGPYFEQLKVIARGNLLYNEAMLAQSNIGAVLGIKLNCRYDGLRFIPFSPILTATTALAWKKEQVFSSAASTFIQFAKKYMLSISYDDL